MGGNVCSCLRRRKSRKSSLQLTGYDNSINVHEDSNDATEQPSGGDLNANENRSMEVGSDREVVISEREVGLPVEEVNLTGTAGADHQPTDTNSSDNLELPWPVPVEDSWGSDDPSVSTSDTPTATPGTTSHVEASKPTSYPDGTPSEDGSHALSYPVVVNRALSNSGDTDDSDGDYTCPKAIARSQSPGQQPCPQTDTDPRLIPLGEGERRKLERCSEWLQRRMRPERVVRQLREGEWLTYRQEETVLAQPTRWEKVNNVLDIIQRGSSGHYLALLEALRQHNQAYIADGLDAGQPAHNPATRLPLQYQNKLRQVHLKDVPRSNRELNRALGFDRQDQLLYARLLLDTGQIQKAKYKEDYLRRASENFQRPTTVILEDVFSPLPALGLSTPRTVILVGGAGMGKTTASHKISLTWAKMEDVNDEQDVQALYKFECRKMNKLSEMSLADLIFRTHGPFVRDSEEQDAILEALDSSASQFVIDGLDELTGLDLTDSDCYQTVRDVRQTADVHTIIYNLFKGNLLPQARLLFTSRPNDILDFRDFERVVIALGFDQDAIRQCMLILCEENEQICEAVMEHITCTTQLYIHCVVPLACVMLGIIVRNDLKAGSSRDIILDRATQVYIRVALLLLGCRMDSPPKNRFQVLDHWRPTIYKLMALAAHGTLGSDIKIVFTGDDLAEKFTAEDMECGLVEMTTDYPPLAEDLERSAVQVVSFIHLSFQEFFAAMSVAVDWETDVLDRIFKPQPSRIYDMVLLYLAGLLGDPVGHKFLGAVDANQTADVLKDKAREMFTRMADSKRNFDSECSLGQLKRDALLTIECLNEGHMSSLVPDMEELLLETVGEEAVLDLCEVKGGLFPHQVAAVAYFIQSSRSLTGIDLGYNCIGPRGIDVLATRCAQFSRLKILRLEQVGLLDAGVQNLVPLLTQNRDLEILILSSNNFGPVGAKSLAEGCRDFKSLVEFRVHFNPLTDVGMESLAPIIANNTNLKRLSLDGADLTDNGAVMLSKSLEAISGIAELRLVANSIQDEGAMAIGSALRDNSHLQRIFFKRNDISPDTRKELKSLFEERIHI